MLATSLAGYKTFNYLQKTVCPFVSPSDYLEKMSGSMAYYTSMNIPSGCCERSYPAGPGTKLWPLEKAWSSITVYILAPKLSLRALRGPAMISALKFQIKRDEWAVPLGGYGLTGRDGRQCLSRAGKPLNQLLGLSCISGDGVVDEVLEDETSGPWQRYLDGSEELWVEAVVWAGIFLGAGVFDKRGSATTERKNNVNNR